MRYYILLFITLFFPVCMWGQFDPSNPNEPSMNIPNVNFNYEVYKTGVVFINESSGASRYEWDFGDGTTSTEKNPEHVYTQAGNYFVKLKAFNGVGESTFNQYINISADYTISGNFTLDPSKNGIRNFQSLDAMFQDLLDLQIAGDITITAAQNLHLRLSELKISDIVDPLTEKFSKSTYKVRLDQESGYSSTLYLWDEFNKETYRQLEKLAEYFYCYPSIYLGEYRFYMNARSYLFGSHTICYGRSSDQIGFESYSNVFSYEWKLAEPPVGLSNYEESGTHEIPPMSIINTTDKYQPLKYEVLFKYNGETYASDIVTFWVHPQTPYLNLSEPSASGLIATPNDVNVSWEPIPGDNYYHYEVYIRKNGESEFQYKKGTNSNECHINNSYDNYFEYDQSYEWYVQTWNSCNGNYIKSEIRTFTIGPAADLEITDIKVEPQTAVSGKKFKITATVTNIGTKDIQTMSWTDHLTGTNNKLFEDKEQLEKSLAAGESYEASFTLTAPYDETLDSLKFELKIDVYNSLRELSKINNLKEIKAPLALLSIPEEEFKVLCDLYNQTGGDKWNLNRPWDITTNAVDKEGWEGVTLDDDGHVISINLSQRNLVGTIPAGLFSMPYLEVLDLSNNTLSGKLNEIIPKESNAPKLQTIYLGQNQISGTIPISINQLSELTKLTLNNNQLDAVEGMILQKINLFINGQKLPNLEIKLKYPFDLHIPNICLYNHEDQVLIDYPEFSLKVPGSSTPMQLEYDKDNEAYRIRWDNYYHHINLPSGQDLTLTQTTGSAKSSETIARLIFPQGDANMDAAVDVKDIRHTLNFITEDNNSHGDGMGYINFNYYAANTYQEEQEESIINVQDMVATVNIILEAPQTMAVTTLRSLETENKGAAASLSIEDGKLVINNPVEPVMDLDITLKNVTSKQLELLLPADSYLYKARDIEGGVRFILVCMNGSGIPLGKTSIMKVNGSRVSVAHAQLTNKAANEVSSDYEGKEIATENESLNLNELSANSIRIDGDIRSLAISVYNMGGHFISYNQIKEIVPGNYNIRQWLPQELPAGVYLVYIELHKANEIKQQTIKVSLIK